MVERDYIDITPKGIDREGQGQAGRKTTVFQETEWTTINENPGRLTKEGVDKKIELWSRSSNKHNELLYRTMKARCQKLAPSGITEDDRVIFSRKADGTPHWLDVVAIDKIKEKKIETKK